MEIKVDMMIERMYLRLYKEYYFCTRGSSSVLVIAGLVGDDEGWSIVAVGGVAGGGAAGLLDAGYESPDRLTDGDG